MTHDELLAYINKEIDQAAWTKEYYPFKSLQALRAVVELHKPFEEFGDDASCEECFNADYSHKEQPYPCPTIQAIEMELS